MVVTELLIALLAQTLFREVLALKLWKAMRESMAQGERYLREQVALLLQGLEQGAFVWAAPLIPAFQQWQFLPIAALVLVIFGLGLCWCLRRRSRQPASPRKEDTNMVKAGEKAPEEESTFSLEGCRISAQRHLDLSDSFIMVEQLVDELLRVCGDLCRNSFLPQLGPVVGVGCTLQGWSPCGEDAVYRLLVPLAPPPGHAFRVEKGTTGKDQPAWKSSLRVELECTCLKEPPAKDMLCFLHHRQEELRTKQAPSLRVILCNGPYLDLEKTFLWFSIVLKKAWAHMPLATHCRLTVLPSSHSCKLQLTRVSTGSSILIEMAFGVKQGDFYFFLG